MKKINKGTTFIIAAVLAGSMAFMSGCGASDKSVADQAESVTIQEESTAEVAESNTEEIQSTQAETETESPTTAKTESETETKTEAETEKESEVKTESQAETMSKSEEQPPESREETPTVERTVSEGDFAVVVKGVTIPLKGDMSVYAAQLGEPDAFGSAKSCTEAGDDKVYTYGGAVIYTYITNGVDVISLIEITGGESLPSGIHIGSTKADVIAAYGSSYTEEGTELLYEMGNRTIGLQMSGDTVSFIEIYG